MTNILAVALVMVAIYGYYALLDPRVGTRFGRPPVIAGWVAGSALFVGILTQAGADGSTPAELLGWYVGYGAVMSHLMAEARIVRVTTPLLLASTGLALAGFALADPDAAGVGILALYASPFVVYVAVVDKTPTWLRVGGYLWCMAVFAIYTLLFLRDELVRTVDDVSAQLVAVPFLLVRLSSFAAMLGLFIPLRGRSRKSYRWAANVVAGHARLERVPIWLVVAIPAAAAGIMVIGDQLGHAPGAFVAVTIAAHELGRRLEPNEFEARDWWRRA